eukprot:TRINITY_DN9094_c0_g1_i1.p1 TRINITY_DN9094_c0_g1~~TRINITY_DN9094_c0_g1_i1.p1  ORF type:complete len:376 (-),score=45.35 TRINITY_DN9094_c0_g1_i1:167-1183(-)
MVQLRAILLFAAAFVAVAALADKQAAPCFWQSTVDLSGQSYKEFLCANVEDGSSLVYEASSVSGYDEFSLLTFTDKQYAAWSQGLQAICSNAGCDRKDSYSKSGSLRVSAADAPFHVVLIHAAEESKTAQFEAMVSVSVGAAFIPGGQLTGGPPPPPANVCQAIEEALPSFCTLFPDCATIDCQVPLYFDTFNVELQMNFCANPINVALSINDTDDQVQWNETVSIGDWLIPIPGATIEIPVLGNATLEVVIFLDGSRSGLNISLGLEACLNNNENMCFPDPPIAIITGVFDFTGLPCPPSMVAAPTIGKLHPAVEKQAMIDAASSKNQKPKNNFMIA